MNDDTFSIRVLDILYSGCSKNGFFTFLYVKNNRESTFRAVRRVLCDLCRSKKKMLFDSSEKKIVKTIEQN